MKVKVATVVGYYFDDPEDDVEFILEAMDKSDAPRCRIKIKCEEFTLTEWKAFTSAVEAAFYLITEET